MSLHDPAYAGFVRMLVDLRVGSGKKQREVAKALGWNQSVVSKIETRQRRIDVVELIRVMEALGADPAVLVRQIQRELISNHAD